MADKSKMLLLLLLSPVWLCISNYSKICWIKIYSVTVMTVSECSPISYFQHWEERCTLFERNSPCVCLLLPVCYCVSIIAMRLYIWVWEVQSWRLTDVNPRWPLLERTCWLGNHLCTQSRRAPLPPYPLWQTCRDDTVLLSHPFSSLLRPARW